MIRITGGDLRGRAVRTLRGVNSRPVLSRVREAVFNILGRDIEEVEFVDLFCGVGTVGIEALSRGARRAVFVERDVRCVRLLQRNLVDLGLENRARVVRGEALRWLGHGPGRFEVVFADPPYGSGLALETLRVLGAGPVLGGWGVVQHGRRDELPAAAGRLERVRSRRYGETAVSFYRSTSGPAPAPPGDGSGRFGEGGCP